MLQFTEYRDGMPVEKKVVQYLQELIRLFRESPEGRALEDEGLYPGFWGGTLTPLKGDELLGEPARL